MNQEVYCNNSIDSNDELSEESLEFCASVGKHLRNSGAINRFLANIVFVGLPGSGKSTLIARLLNLKGVDEMIKTCESTGIMEGIITVNVDEDEAFIHAADVMDKNYDWQKVELGLSCLRQMGVGCFVLHQAPEASSSPTSPGATDSAKKNTPMATKHHNLKHKSNISTKLQAAQIKVKSKSATSQPQRVQKLLQSDVMSTIKSLLRKKGYSAVRPFLKNKTSLYLSDTGQSRH